MLFKYVNLVDISFQIQKLYDAKWGRSSVLHQLNNGMSEQKRNPNNFFWDTPRP